MINNINLIFEIRKSSKIIIKYDTYYVYNRISHLDT